MGELTRISVSGGMLRASTWFRSLHNVWASPKFCEAGVWEIERRVITALRFTRAEQITDKFCEAISFGREEKRERGKARSLCGSSRLINFSSLP